MYAYNFYNINDNSNIMTKFIGLVGAGYWGKNLVRDFYKLGSLHTICDLDENQLKEHKEKYTELNITTDYDNMLKDPNITAICIAVNSNFHHSLAKKALLADKDVYVEKPMCLDESHGEELVKLSKEHNKILMVGHLLQYHPCVLKMKELVNSGKIGKIVYMTSNRMNLGKFRKEENVLWSFAPHDISVLLSFAKEMPYSVLCDGQCHITNEIEDITTTIMKFNNGIYAQINVNRLCPYKEQKMVIVGTEGMLIFDDVAVTSQKLSYISNYVEWDGINPKPIKNHSYIDCDLSVTPLEMECRHFIECCQTRKNPTTDGQEGLNVLRVLNMSQKSLHETGSKIHLKDYVSKGDFYVHPSAFVDDKAVLGKGTKVWHSAHLMNCKVGEDCSFGQNSFVGNNVVIGNNVRVQNNVNVYDGVICENNIFLGPSCTFTNDKNPRAEFSKNGQYHKTIVKEGSSVGANATIVCGVTLNEYSFIGAGAVVTKDVPPYTLVVGNPARPLYKVNKFGERVD